ncbi:M20/M25/M40 family metallo-hydrolase [Bdellovibrionota bacterium FG-2]
MKTRNPTLLPALVLLAASWTHAEAGNGTIDFEAMTQSARESLGALVEANTTNPPGNEKRAVDIVASRLKAVGISYEITEFAPGRQSIVARLKGTGTKKPVMLVAHLDVVGAEGQTWTVDPHKLTEKDGYLYGRGVNDMLGMAAVNLEIFLALKRQGIKLRRDVILTLVGDEESNGDGIRYILKNSPESINAGFVLNEGGAPILDEKGNIRFVTIQGAEKTYQDFELSVTGKTGHSSVPFPDNAIYRLSGALARLGKFKFPARLLPITRAYFAARAKIEKPAIANAMKALANSPENPKAALPEAALKVIEAEPLIAPNLRTTCVATMLSAGTRVNALPAGAKATINCRVLPDETLDQVRKTLLAVIADPQVQLKTLDEFERSDASPVAGADIETLKKIILQTWPGVPIIPYMMFGATDSRFLRRAGIPSYGLLPIAETEDDGRRSHGIDERIRVKSFREGIEFFYRLMIALAAT